jgi:cytokinin dehydrogenase
MAADWTTRLPTLRGEISQEKTQLDIAELDFGKIRRRRPLAVLRPADAGDVVTAVTFCRQEQIALATRGCAHSAGGQMMAPGGLVIDMKSLDKVLEITDDYIDVEAGISWSAVLEATMASGRTPPVVTDWLGVSVGGTISMGGFGFMSFNRGTQMDHLLELEVVTGSGKRYVCSASQGKELFDAVRGTHGQFGIITRARIPLEVAPEAVRMLQVCYGSLRNLLEDMRRIVREGEANLVHGFAAEKSIDSVATRMNSKDAMSLSRADIERVLLSVPGDWIYNLEVSDLIHAKRTPRPPEPRSLGGLPGMADTWELSWKDFCFRRPPLILEEEDKGAAPHPELTVFLPLDDRGIDLAVNEFERLHPATDIGQGPVLFFSLDKRLITAPFLRLPKAQPYGFFLGILRRADPPTDDRIKDLIADNEAIYERVLDCDGVRYLPDTLPLSSGFWRRHYGDLWPRLVELKSLYDPDDILASSFGAAVSEA